MIRRLFCIQWQEENWGINTTPNSMIKYLWCWAFGHDMEPFNYDESEPCKRCGIEDDRNCMYGFIERRARQIRRWLLPFIHLCACCWRTLFRSQEDYCCRCLVAPDVEAAHDRLTQEEGMPSEPMD
jgi:hypothetical protein